MIVDATRTCALLVGLPEHVRIIGVVPGLRWLQVHVRTVTEPVVCVCRRRMVRLRSATQIVEVRRGQLLDVVEGRDASGAARWLNEQHVRWRDQIVWATLDLTPSYWAVYDTMLPDAVQVADPFHVVQLANRCVDETRRRVQNETLGHRGRKDDPLYRARRRLLMARQKLSPAG